MKFDFFISYSRDIYQEFVEKFIYDIENLGINVWIDKKEVNVGDDIIKNLYDVLNRTKNSYGVILILDASYFKKKWCLKELEYIMKNSIKCFPILYKITKEDIPDQYSFLRKLNIISVLENTKISYVIDRMILLYLEPLNDNFLYPLIQNELFNHMITSLPIIKVNSPDYIFLIDNLSIYIEFQIRKEKNKIDRSSLICINFIHLKKYKLLKSGKLGYYDSKIVSSSMNLLLKRYFKLNF